MRFARNKNGNKIEVSFSGEKAICRDCNIEVYGRKGKFRTYWTHPNNSDCDKWHEPITKWHIDWQNRFPIEWQEISLKDYETNEIHRADVKIPNGTVIEVQNSPIKVDEIEQRENFYGQENLIWIINGNKLASQSRINYSFEKQVFAISHEIPEQIDEFPDYNMDEINNEFWGSELIAEISAHPDIKNVDNQNGYFYWFEYNKAIDFQNEINKIENKINQIIIDLYGRDNYLRIIRHFVTKEYFVPKNRYRNVKLEKKYWRQFIDLMKFPVFIDNISGLNDNLIYWYQKNEIIEKNILVEKLVKNKNWLQQRLICNSGGSQ